MSHTHTCVQSKVGHTFLNPLVASRSNTICRTGTWATGRDDQIYFVLIGGTANDFWGKQFLALSGEKKMTQQLAIATGCAAGATESFVVVPFELVKIKCVP